MSMYFDNIALNGFLRESDTRQYEREQGIISYSEHFEWKVNWP